VGRDRARRRAAVDRRHGSCASEIVTPAGCATLARTVPPRSARARRAQGSFPHTGPPLSPRLGRSSVTANPRSRRSSSRSPCSGAADRHSPERLRRERRTRSGRSVSDAAPCPLEDVLSHNRPPSIARLRLHFSHRQRRRPRRSKEGDQATGRRGLEFDAVAVGLLEHAAMPGDKRGGRATKLAGLRRSKREASGRDKRNSRESCSHMSWGSPAGHRPWDRQPLPTS
jgi:hypothetical protein